jgi:hypothetical protein
VGTALEFSRRPASSAAGDFFNGNHGGAHDAGSHGGMHGAGTDFASWRSYNFPPSTANSDDEPSVFFEGKGFVILRVPIPCKPKDGAQIMEASKSSFRQFTPSWKSEEPRFFHYDLLKISPREVTNDSKEGIYHLSKDVLGDNGGIDFFLSHSWDEKELGSKQKYNALKSFLSGTAPRASLWFDKTCLNTADKAANATAIAQQKLVRVRPAHARVHLKPQLLQYAALREDKRLLPPHVQRAAEHERPRLAPQPPRAQRVAHVYHVAHLRRGGGALLQLCREKHRRKRHVVHVHLPQRRAV